MSVFILVLFLVCLFFTLISACVSIFSIYSHIAYLFSVSFLFFFKFFLFYLFLTHWFLHACTLVCECLYVLVPIHRCLDDPCISIYTTSIHGVMVDHNGRVLSNNRSEGWGGGRVLPPPPIGKRVLARTRGELRDSKLEWIGTLERKLVLSFLY